MLSDSFLFDRLMQSAAQKQSKKEGQRDNSNTSGRGRQQAQKQKKQVIRGKIVQQVALSVRDIKTDKSPEEEKNQLIAANRSLDRQLQDGSLYEQNEETNQGLLTQQLNFNPELDNADPSDTHSNF